MLDVVNVCECTYETVYPSLFNHNLRGIIFVRSIIIKYLSLFYDT